MYRQRRLIAAILVMLLPAWRVSADDNTASRAAAIEAALAELTPEARQAAEELIATLPEDSEARVMLNSLLAGNQVGDAGGWFQIAVPQSRYDWDYVTATYDSNSDDAISMEELPVSQADFARIDRNRDRRLTADDFDYERQAGAKPAGRQLYNLLDRNGDGRATPEELQEWFNSLDTDDQGFLALSDVRDEVTSVDPADVGPKRRNADPSMLVMSLRNQEMGALQPGPDLNEIAPDFTLRTLDGEEVTLSEEVGELPIVLIFGNFTCTPFRQHAGDIEKLYDRYEGRAKFFLVYVREAHPENGWYSQNNHRAGIEVFQPTNDGERLAVAQTCQQHMDLGIPFLVDTTADVVGTTYSGMPNRLYLIDSDGRIAFKNGRGPFWFYPRQLEQALVLHLADQSLQVEN